MPFHCAINPMPPASIARTAARAGIVAILVVAFALGALGCGQRGPLYLPDKDNPDKRK